MKNELPDLSAMLGSALSNTTPETAPAAEADKPKLTRGGVPKEPKTAKAPEPHRPGVLTESEKALLEAEAQKEVDAEIHAKAMAEHKAQIKSALKKKALFKDASGEDYSEENILVRLDMAPHVPHVILDGVIYHPGYVYPVSPAVAKVLRDQMYRSYLHDAEINGIDINAYLGRQHMLKQISPSNPNGV